MKDYQWESHHISKISTLRKSQSKPNMIKASSHNRNLKDCDNHAESEQNGLDFVLSLSEKESDSSGEG